MWGRILVIGLSLATVLQPGPAAAQWLGAAERAAARRAGMTTKARATASTADRKSVATATKWGDARVVKTWRTADCSASRPCPLPPDVGNRFQAGRYEEVVLTQPVVLRGRLTAAEVKAGGPTTVHTSLYDRTKVLDARRQRMTTPYGTSTPRSYLVQLQPGTKVYRGISKGWPGGLQPGDEITVVSRVPQSWISPD